MRSQWRRSNRTKIPNCWWNHSSMAIIKYLWHYGTYTAMNFAWMDGGPIMHGIPIAKVIEIKRYKILGVMQK